MNIKKEMFLRLKEMLDDEIRGLQRKLRGNRDQIRCLSNDQRAIKTRLTDLHKFRNTLPKEK